MEKSFLMKCLSYLTYILGAIIVGKSLVYIFMRGGTIIDSMENKDYVLLLALLCYVLLLTLWAVLVITLSKAGLKVKLIKDYVSAAVLVFSSAYLVVFNIPILPDVEPLDFLYFVNEIAWVAVALSIVCLVSYKVSPNNK